ncbi:TIM21 protein, partial [Ostertagia ostertagi]
YVYRWLCGTRNFAEKRGSITPQNKEQTGLQRSVLEEVLIKEKQKPTTFTGKACFKRYSTINPNLQVAEKASNTFLYTAVAAAIGMLGVFVYLLAGEFFAEDSPQKIYSSALSLVREDGRCHDLFGPTIAGFGEETSRGRRRHVSTTTACMHILTHHMEPDQVIRGRSGPSTAAGPSGGEEFLIWIKMEDDGFELVRCKRRHARLKKTALASVSRIEGTVDDIQAAMEKTNSQVEDSGLSSWIINKIRRFLGDRRISCVYLIGNGHFDAPWEAGTHQLALTRRICRAFDAQMIFQEPCISNAEREWLSRQDGIVLRDQPDVCLDILGDDQNSVGIAVVLHGVHGLLNDFLSFNWRVALHRILLLCNDYRDI